MKKKEKEKAKAKKENRYLDYITLSKKVIDGVNYVTIDDATEALLMVIKNIAPFIKD